MAVHWPFDVWVLGVTSRCSTFSPVFFWFVVKSPGVQYSVAQFFVELPLMACGMMARLARLSDGLSKVKIGFTRANFFAKRPLKIEIHFSNRSCAEKKPTIPKKPKVNH